MAFIDFSSAFGCSATSIKVERSSAADAQRTGSGAGISSSVVNDASLSALEWLVVSLARRDRLSSLRAPGRMASAMGVLFGQRPNPRLADPKLEALRRLAVYAWHQGFAVPVSAVKAFVAAGYTNDHYELLLASVSKARLRRVGAR